MAPTPVLAALGILYEDILRAKAKNPHLVCIQRINDNDVRKGTNAMDRLLAEANRAADHTVFVSEWLRDYHASRWFDAAKPHSVILNGADPGLSPDRRRSMETRPFASRHAPLVGQYEQGFDFYREIDEAIASGGFPDTELWVIGRWPKDMKWRKARTFPPCVGHKLAGLLRQCHGYVTASRMNPGPCIRSKAFNADFRLFIIPRPEGLWSLAGDTGSKYPTNLRNFRALSGEL